MVILGNIEINQPDSIMVIINELSALDLALRFPDQEGSNRILSQYGIVEPLDLFFFSNEGSLNIRQPESALFV